MNRYLVFVGCKYSPEGGMKDLIGSKNTIIECFNLINKDLLYSFTKGNTLTEEEYLKTQKEINFAHILDTVTGEFKNIY